MLPSLEASQPRGASAGIAKRNQYRFHYFVPVSSYAKLTHPSKIVYTMSPICPILSPCYPQSCCLPVPPAVKYVSCLPVLFKMPLILKPAVYIRSRSVVCGAMFRVPVPVPWHSVIKVAAAVPKSPAP